MSAAGEARLQRRMLVIAAIAVGLLACFTGSGEQAPVLELPSTMHTGDGGARALYELMRELGLGGERWMQPTDGPAFRERVEVLVLLGTGASMTQDEADALVAWVREGGRLFHAPSVARPGSDDDDPLLEALGIRRVANAQGGQASQRPAEQQSPEALLLLAGTPREVRAPAGALDLSGLPAPFRPEVLLGTDGGDATLALVHAGAGRLVLLGDVSALTNAELEKSDVLPAAVRALAALADGRPPWFDEFHHGYDERAGTTAALGHFLVGTHAGWALLALAGVALLAVVCRGQRLGPPVPEPQAPGRTSLEHVDALAAGWAVVRARARPASLLVEGLRLRLGVPHQRDLDERLAAIARRTPGLAGAVARIRGALAGAGAASPETPARPAELVPLADAIDAVLAEEGRRALPSGWDARA